MPNRVLGFSLIEVLISFLLLSFILIFFNTLQVTSLKKMKEVYFYSVAENQLANFLRAPFISLNDWNIQNQEILPQGKGVKSEDKISVFWNQSNKLEFPL